MIFRGNIIPIYKFFIWIESMTIVPLTLTVVGGLVLTFKIFNHSTVKPKLVMDRRTVEDSVDCLAENIRAVSIKR